MKFSQKITLMVLLVAIIAASLDAANKRGRDSRDDEEQPAAAKNQQVRAGQTARSLVSICNAAQARLEEQFPFLVGGAWASAPSVVTPAGLAALQGAAGALKIVTSRGVSAGVDARFDKADKLADDAITAIRNVVLNTREELVALGEAIDAYNDARNRLATAAGEPIPRLRDAAIANENGEFRFSDEQIAAYDAGMGDLLVVGDVPVSAASLSGSIAKTALPADWMCNICFDNTIDEDVHAPVQLPCMQAVPHIFHKKCIVAWFTLCIQDKMDVPECPVCKTHITEQNMPLALRGALPTINPANLLFSGAINQRIDLIDRAIEMGVDINERYSVEGSPFYNWTPLHVAAYHGYQEVVEFLCSKGADKEAKDVNNNTPLHLAAWQGHREVVAFLCSNGADKEARAKENMTPLHLAAYQGHLNVVEFLWCNGADKEARAKENMTPLHVAASQGHLNVVEFLWCNGADKEAKNANNNTPLHLAAWHGHREVVEFLWATGADKEAKDVNNNTPLHLAAWQGHLGVVEFLWPNGADKEARAEENMPPLHVAVYHGQQGVVEFLWRNGADKEARAKENMTPLHVAASQGHLNVVEFLWCNGADKEARAKNNMTPLHVAAYYGHLNVVEFLWRNGANKEAKTLGNNTPLHIAAWHGHQGVVGFLINEGANIQAKNNSEKTALDVARVQQVTNPTRYDGIITLLEAAAVARV